MQAKLEASKRAMSVYVFMQPNALRNARRFGSNRFMPGNGQQRLERAALAGKSRQGRAFTEPVARTPPRKGSRPKLDVTDDSHRAIALAEPRPRHRGHVEAEQVIEPPCRQTRRAESGCRYERWVADSGRRALGGPCDMRESKSMAKRQIIPKAC